MTRCSFIVPARNEERYIAACLNSIKRTMQRLGSDDYEIIVADNSSTDGTVDIVRGFGDVRLMMDIPTKINVSELRNMAVDISFGEVLIFIDGDVVLADDWYKQLPNVIDHVTQLGDAIVGAYYGYSKESSWVTQHWYAPQLLTNSSKYIPGGHMIMSRKTFDALDGFDMDLETGEDVDICKRAIKRGGAVISWPEMKTAHLGYPDTIKDFFNRERWHGKGNWFPLENVNKSMMARMLAVNVLVLLLSIPLAFMMPALLLVSPVLIWVSATALGIRHSQGFAKYVPASIFLSAVQIVARFMSLVDVIKQKDSYLLRKGG